MMPLNLLQTGDFKLASGRESNFKIECDALTDDDWDTVAKIVKKRFMFQGVTGVPRGGLKLAERLLPFIYPHVKNYLIVDDVYSTGGSLRRVRDELIAQPDGGNRHYFGVVLFARNRIVDADKNWVRPIFQMEEY